MERRTVGLIVVFSAVLMAAGGLFWMDRARDQAKIPSEIAGWPQFESESGYRLDRTYDPETLEQAVSAIETASAKGVESSSLESYVRAIPQTWDTPFSDVVGAYSRLRKISWNPEIESRVLSMALDSLLAYSGSPAPSPADQSEVVAMMLRQAELVEVTDRGVILRHWASLDQWEKHHRLPSTLTRKDLPNEARQYAAFVGYAATHADAVAQSIRREVPSPEDRPGLDAMNLVMICGDRLARDPGANEFREFRRTLSIVGATGATIVSDPKNERLIQGWVNEKVGRPVMLPKADVSLIGGALEGVVLVCDGRGNVLFASDDPVHLRVARANVRQESPSRPRFAKINGEPPERIVASSAKPLTLSSGAPRSSTGGFGVDMVSRVARTRDNSPWNLPIRESPFVR